MNHDNYSKSEIDLKFSTLEEDMMASKFELLNQKWDASVQQILSQTKVLLLEREMIEKSAREAEMKTTTRWFIGLILSLTGLAISIIVNFFLR
ncbi:MULTISPECIES: hypothetical protein [unclassified Streptococcus]|uniref:hypothetical protein n=1 Tax=unclassified Streptococcus TaxID=2608887 RepID=UPI0018AA44B2|nr:MULTISPECIES: hypothetical protein [unclassified Streptococcus]MBF8971069.1 hypothetical protein [Streptococcus sp. NLN76]MBG9368057.1 hypothetical protein [Streptococcus sp. NLN64]